MAEAKMSSKGEAVVTAIISKEVQELLNKKDARIRELEDKVKATEKERDDMIDNFQTSTEVLLERIKELESISLGARPQTANILQRIGISLQSYLCSENARTEKDPLDRKNHNYYVSESEPKENVEEIKASAEEDKNGDEPALCTNCGDAISPGKMVTHTVACYRNSTKCKVCGERLKKTMKAEHLAAWRSNEKLVAAIEKNSEEELTLVLDHGVSPEQHIGSNNQSMRGFF